MTDLKNIKQVYFLGIGGIGMSALARWFKHAGFGVSGYDRTETELTQKLVAEGIDVHYADRPDLLLSQLDKQACLVVLTPAVPADLAERIFLEENGFTIKKRSQVLGMICDQGKTCAVAGTHGKTTVSTMTAHLLKSSRLDCSAFLGGISKNYQTNLLLSAHSAWVVAEADEFDRSFLQLHPDFAVVTSTDADHLDIYGDQAAIHKTFREFVGQIRPGGAVVVKKGLPIQQSDNPEVQYFSYSITEQADFCAVNIELKDEAYHFDLKHPNGVIRSMQLNYPGLLNVENTVAASALALLAGADENEIKAAVATYQGVKRRFDIRHRSNDYMLIDDYAHHPEELKATIGSVKAMFADRWLTGVFQPHLFSRTRDFAPDFAEQLSQLDELYLLDIYPAREKPIPGVSSAMVLEQVSLADKQLVTKDELLQKAASFKPGVILMMGAGDIDLLVEPVAQTLNAKTND
ncbi:UDP-N-acetylmuramate--L-alanine ligase [Mangrovibacterium marinum]|uniref:UDP-N-acetylmuramate--L-alanine ligase n=1 Tax=Mangrovibacterium marinum TaxID=1639118 RepID=UPI002A188A46|nr:UDP-N-acetylmuramate--L-alanine ligase [Mangrovibacterium marinum]